MSLKKTVAIAAAAGALAAISVPAMAFENEFHGMYRAYGYMTNALSGAGGFNVAKNSRTDKYIEQRARLQYIAKASDNLKLVTHFELDTKFGGAAPYNKYYTNDAGGLDADAITLETKNVYLDFNIPSSPVNVKVGIQPWGDALQNTFGLFDATGAVFTGKFGALTTTYGYFTVGGTAGTPAAAPAFDSNFGTRDLNVLDAKFAINKDITVGTSYYMVLDKVGAATLANNTFGLNASAKMGPAALNFSAGMQFGKENSALAFSGKGTTAFGGALAATVDAGPGKVKIAALYLSGDKDGAANFNHAWQPINAATNYFIPANMWLIGRNIATINSSTAVGGNGDITRGGRGILGLYAGFAGTAGKTFYDANLGWAKVAEKRTATSAAIGTELNATVGYKLYDNLSASFTAAYCILGKGYNDNATTAVLLPGGVKDADNPFLTNVALNYSF